ncbi:SDR family oxidoreductase [Pelodictyon luteolum]|uniref:Oxidoreductase, short-chain dehydrogenase/reductase family n=1 Tax=Chlorobium luteolum (strain DSM 273 / BCRC 81028 / 2530) TaxID=319225 RepID=Q3B3B2_CHLL3|nr:SDR family oxidoreductase [Pelodictyon luteolum]ABB24169.1 oxidoreductase, short-chain dehydrogenase/reductase family [Pelodictyon luteolum DSM 273]
MTERTTGKTILITGASTGIGQATALLLAEGGWNVALAARSRDKLLSLTSQIGTKRALAIPTDVADWQSQETMVRKTLERFGTIDAVFANAGFSKGSSFLGGPDQPDEWRQMVLVNVYGAAATARLTLPELVKSRGHFLITGSVVGRVTSIRNLYSATKWAVTGMAQAIRNEMAGTGVRVTLVQPGVVDTPFWESIPKPGTPELQPEDIARAVQYALLQPAHVDVNEIIIRPTGQPH